MLNRAKHRAGGRCERDLASRGRSGVLQHAPKGADVLRGGTAATANHADAQISNESRHALRHRFCLQWVFGPAVNQDGQSRIGDDRNGTIPMLGQPFHVWRHLGRTCRAIESQTGHGQTPQGGSHGRNFRANQQRPGGFDRHRNHDGQLFWTHTSCFKGMQSSVDRATNLQRVLTGFDQKSIDSTVEQTVNLRSVGVMHR